MRVFVTGGSGMLGQYVLSFLELTSHTIIQGNRPSFDLDRPMGLYEQVIAAAPNIILHLAAETDVDLCERTPKVAAVKNHIATEAIARAANNLSARLIYISTSNVFGAEGKLIYNELDAPSSVNYYGRSKLLGEFAVRSALPYSSLIVRAGWMIGGGAAADHKFVGKIVQQIRSGVTNLRAVNDRLGNITSASSLAQFLLWAIDSEYNGTIHFSSSGLVSRMDIAGAIGAFFKVPLKVEPVSSALFPLSAPRPVSEGLTSLYLDDLEGAPRPRSWNEDLNSYLETF